MATLTETATAPARFVTAGEIADDLRISKRTLRRMIMNGKFPRAALTLNGYDRWRRDDVERWIGQQSQQDAPVM